MSTPTESCECYPTYSASATANGSAYVTVVTPPSLVTSQASASASSTISPEDAYAKAQILAQNIANSIAQNDANIITQAVILSRGTNSGTGYTGPTGPQGFTGSASGSGGSTGPIGPTGADGSIVNFIDLFPTGSTGTFLLRDASGNIYDDESILSFNYNRILPGGTVMAGRKDRNFIVGGNLIPGSSFNPLSDQGFTGAYSLGDPLNRWNHLYVDGGSIELGLVRLSCNPDPIFTQKTGLSGSFFDITNVNPVSEGFGQGLIFGNSNIYARLKVTGATGITGIFEFFPLIKDLYTGPTGENGVSYTGATGPVGIQGVAGTATNTGARGPQGFTGPAGGGGGGTGYTGPRGSTGNAGSTGPQGFTGPAGSGGGSSSGTTTFGFEVIYSVTTSAVVGQPITTDNYTQIYSINPLSGFPSLPGNISVNFTNVTQSATVHKSFIIFTNNSVNTSTTPTNLQYLVWPVICYTSPLSIATSPSAASISTPSLMLYSNTNVVSKPSFQGPFVSAVNTGANTPIVGASNTTIYLDLTFKNSVNLGGNLTNYQIQTGDNVGNVTFLGAFIYITFNNAVLNI